MVRYSDSESSVIELKREIPRNDQIIKTVIGFCNSNGGKLVIGVADNREIIGLSERAIEEAMEVIDQSLFDACSPHIIPRLYMQRFGEKSVLIVEVGEGMNKPYYRRSEGLDKGVYIRLGRHTLRADQNIIEELHWQSRGIDFERLPVFQATMDDLDEKAIRDFVKHRKNHGTDVMNESILKSYNIIAYDHSRKYPSVLGVLLFGKNPQEYFSESMLICTHFRGVSGREAIATVDCEGTLFNQFHQAFAFITERLYKTFSIKQLKRDERLEIPEVAIREALLNLIVHRNYHIKAPSKIAIYADRVEFFSPGQFPGPINIENLKTGVTYLRNPAICKILREADYIEKLGSGFITIFESYEKQGLKIPKVIEGENYVKCILPREKKKEEAKLEDILEKLTALIKMNQEMSVSDMVKTLSISKTTTLRKLDQLMRQGLIEKIGQARSTRYRLKE